LQRLLQPIEGVRAFGRNADASVISAIRSWTRWLIAILDLWDSSGRPYITTRRGGHRGCDCRPRRVYRGSMGGRGLSAQADPGSVCPAGASAFAHGGRAAGISDSGRCRLLRACPSSCNRLREVPRTASRSVGHNPSSRRISAFSCGVLITSRVRRTL